MEIEKSVYYVKCRLCEKEYLETSISETIEDWNGHNPPITSTRVTPEKCPYCNNDVVKAGEIVKKRREYEAGEYKKDVEKFNKYNCYRIYYENGRIYENITYENLPEGIYVYQKDYESKIVEICKAEKPELCENTYKNKEIINTFFKKYKLPANLERIKVNKSKFQKVLIENVYKYNKLYIYDLLDKLDDEGYIKPSASLYDVNVLYNKHQDILEPIVCWE